MDIRKLLIFVACACCAGCYHVKAVDSYGTMYRNTEPPNSGDPYTFGGMGEASGGTLSKQSEATNTNSDDPRAATETGKAGIIEPGAGTTADVGAGPGTGASQPQAAAPATGARPAGR